MTGRVKCTNGNKFESECSLECSKNQKFSEEGSPLVTCLSNATWSTKLSYCVG